jgi:hypothetical protein
MPTEKIDPRLEAEAYRLRERFDDLSRRFPPISMCLVKHPSYTAESKPPETNGFLGQPPSGKWSSLVSEHKFVRRIVGELGGFVRERSLIYLADSVAWACVNSLAAQAVRCLQLFPIEVSHQIHASRYLLTRGPDEWLWFNLVFDIARDRDRELPYPFIDGDIFGGLSWRTSAGKLRQLSKFFRNNPQEGEWSREVSTITDISTQSYYLINQMLGCLSQDGNASVSPTEKSPTKEEQVAWWYGQICTFHDRELPHDEALEILKMLASPSETNMHFFPPWAPDTPGRPNVKNLSLESFRKYLKRVESRKQKQKRASGGSSVVRQLSASRPPREGDRVVPAEVPARRHKQSRALRAAEDEQKRRDQQARDLGYDLEPPIDSQGDPI